jgi:hypothetical protein
MGKRTNLMASVVAGLGGIHAGQAAEATPFREMPAIEKTATAGMYVGQAADDASSAGDVAKKVEAIDHQLTSEADVHHSPEANPEGDDPQKVLRDLEGAQEEEKRKKAENDVALGDREEVSGGNIIALESPASGESTVTGEGSAVTAADDEERARADAEADQQRAEATARADDESHQQAAAEDEEQFGCPAEESGPADDAWLEDDADVNDSDIH